MLDEFINQAIESLKFACEDLRSANRIASPVESMLLLDVLEQVAKAQLRVEAIQSARQGM